MINIEFDDKSVFTYSAEDLSIQAWDHRKGWLDGDVIGMIGKVKFASLRQLEMFYEMLELLITKMERK